ncbi:hypothetical protein PR202_gb24239 [Eleusine coracana subsp. coracana]|uniref:Uncharacterized protein n=1 Tax=Eleusine coracana subsp. coracana TaxID=191504 RepID=A0AAV5FIC8_ELECO|nr:hypothetical protein PR202_gb24239 [Eleusine coracana subsp. coracana]
MAAALQIQIDLRPADEMKRLVEEKNEEHVLVELTRIEATRELREVEAQRRAEAERYMVVMAEVRAKIEALQREGGRSRAGGGGEASREELRHGSPPSTDGEEERWRRGREG